MLPEDPKMVDMVVKLMADRMHLQRVVSARQQVPAAAQAVVSRVASIGTVTVNYPARASVTELGARFIPSVDFPVAYSAILAPSLSDPPQPWDQCTLQLGMAGATNVDGGKNLEERWEFSGEWTLELTGLPAWHITTDGDS